jgi:hypothetical protein
MDPGEINVAIVKLLTMSESEKNSLSKKISKEKGFQFYVSNVSIQIRNGEAYLVAHEEIPYEITSYHEIGNIKELLAKKYENETD